MAKSKHSTALFEVIHAAQRPTGRSSTPASRASSASLLRTPKWWFKNRSPGGSGSAGHDVPADPNDPTANVTAATLTGARARRSHGAAPADTGDGPFFDPHDEPAAPARVSPPAPAPNLIVAPTVAPPAVPAPRPAPRRLPPPNGTTLRDPSASRAAVHMVLDRDRREITLRFRYAAAAAGTFVLLCAVGIAYVLGRRAGEAPPVAAALAPAVTQTPSAKEIKKGPVQQGALDPQRGGARQASARIDATGATSSGAARTGDESGIYLDAPIGPDGTARRDVNRNYVVVISYPLSMGDAGNNAAAKAATFLTDNGVPCTVEIGSKWIRVVGIRGFQRRFLESREYQSYKKLIISLGEKFASKSNFDKFEPLASKWDGR